MLKSAIGQLYPRTELLPGAADCDLDAFLAAYRRDTTLLIWSGVVLGALVYQLSPLFTVGVPLPAAALSPARADRHASAIANSNVYLVRQLVFLLKLVAGLAWGQHPQVRAYFALRIHGADPQTWRTE